MAADRYSQRGPNTKAQGPIVNFFKKPYLLVIISVLLLFYAGFQSLSLFSHNLKTTPEAVFQKAFIATPDQVSHLRGEGGWSNFYQACITFESPVRIKLKNENEYRLSVVNPVRNWFHEKFPESKGLMDSAGRYICLFRCKTDNTSSCTEWYLYNPRTSEHFYRIFSQ